MKTFLNLKRGRVEDPAFTAIELLVVVAVIALLALLTVPTLAGVQHKGGVTQCANNLRQIGNGSMAYAIEYDDWLPPGTIGANQPNIVNALYYTRFVWAGPASTRVPGSFTNFPPGTGFANAGYLYPMNFLGNGGPLFCPAQYGTFLGSSAYYPLLTTDSNGSVRSSYGYNPRVNQAGALTTPGNLRRYQKVSQLEPHKLFGIDYFDQDNIFAHVRERGWNVLFTDTSVNFSRSQRAYFVIKTLMPQDPGTPYYNGFTDTAFNLLENDH